MLTALKLLATAGLGAAYLAVAFVAAHPRVDPEYDAHFLHRAADCWIPRALRAGDEPAPPAEIEVTQVGYPEICRYLRVDWYEIEPWGVWATAKQATLRLPRRPGAREVELVLRGVPAPGPTIQVRFVLNGRTTEDEIPAGTTKTVAVPLPPEGAPYDPDMRLYFSNYAVVPGYNYPGRPPGPKTHNIGIGLIAIRYVG